MLPPLLTVAAAWAGKSPFNAPIGKQADADRSKREFSGATYSDHLAVVAAYDGWVGAKAGQFNAKGAAKTGHGRAGGGGGGRGRGGGGGGRGGGGGGGGGGGRGRGGGGRPEVNYCWERFLNTSTLREMDGTRRQFFQQLQAAGFVSRTARLDRIDPASEIYDFARNVGTASLVKCVLTAALYPSVARVGAPAGNGKRPTLITRTESVAIHPASVNSRVEARDLKGYVIFLEKVKTSNVFLRDSTAISHYPLLLFGGSHLRIDHTKGAQKISIVETDGKVWLEFRAEARVGVLFKLLREELDRLLLAQIEAPGEGLSGAGSTAVNAVLQLLDDEEKQMSPW